MKTVVFAVLAAFVLVVPMSAMAVVNPQLTLSAAASVHYDFDGSALSIPVDVQGTPARVTFAVFTKGKADQISRIQNGFRGWHYVDAIDTCVYFSPAYDFPIGGGDVVWSAQTHETYMQEGNSGPVGAGEYTYYLYGYDYVNPRVLASPKYGSLNRMQQRIRDREPDGTPLAAPFVVGQVSGATIGVVQPMETHMKFLLGGDPLNNELIQTCFLGNTEGDTWNSSSWSVWDALAWEDGTFSNCFRKMEQRTSAPLNPMRNGVRKYQWVPNGTAIRDEGWGPDLASWDAKIYLGSGMSEDGTYLYTTSGDMFDYTEQTVRFYIIDMAAGEMLFDFYQSDWTDFDQYNAGVGGAKGADYLNAGAQDYHQIRNGLFYGGSFLCLKQVLDPIRYMETEDYTDFKRWTNKNGDYVSDMNWKVDATFPWACFGETPPKNRSFSPDRYGWVLNMVGQFGAVSFSLFAPDGTGIGYFALQGDAERASGSAQVCDSGSAYDGMYVDLAAGAGFYYVAWDSFSGTITDQAVDVADAAPAAFAVAQNSPNPFNPTTTINFTIPEAGRVNVDVFNVAGQKVDTLVNGSMEAGNHTVTFDGANLAAGVYFYTVKAGEFSKTMKMTLLK